MIDDFAADLTTDLDRDRGLARGLEFVDRDGGDFEAGLIRGAAIITTGVEALGHDYWIDKGFGEQVARKIFAAGKQGVKARFTHPGLSADGLGTFLGRFKRPPGATSFHDLIDGDTVRADLHIVDSAHGTPDGDLAGYVLNLAEEDPGAFGTSIVFKHDQAAEKKFRKLNSHDGEFVSPDDRNLNNYPHARLAELRAIDAVDSPAANPDGLFHRQTTAHQAEGLIAYALGLESEPPAECAFSDIVAPARVAGFVSKFLDRRGLTLAPASTKKGQAMAKDKANDHNEELTDREQLKAYMAEFGAADGATWFADGKTWDECCELRDRQTIEQRDQQISDLTEQLEQRDAKIAELSEKVEQLQGTLAAVELGETNPVSGETPATDTDRPTSLRDIVKIRGNQVATRN